VRWEPTDWLRARVDQEGAGIMGSATGRTTAATAAAERAGGYAFLGLPIMTMRVHI